MIVFSNAKINIGLSVLDKREDGFHNLESIFYPIPLYDIIEFSLAESSQFTNYGIQINRDNNLIIDALNLLKRNFEIPALSINLFKQIPLGAGLGGGSSNASFTLKALNELLKLGLTTSELKRFSLELGSDCPFFIDNSPSLIQGRGEIITAIDFNLQGEYLHLICPNIHLSTAEAFSHLILSSSERITAENWRLARNDFEHGTIETYPEIKALLADIKSKGAIFSSMSGTGSAVYGIFEERPTPLEGIANWVFEL